MTSSITDTDQFSPWSVLHHDPHPHSALSSSRVAEQAGEITPPISPAAQFTRSALPVGSNGSQSTPSPEAGGAKMGEVALSPDRAVQAVVTNANSGQAVTNSRTHAGVWHQLISIGDVENPRTHAGVWHQKL